MRKLRTVLNTNVLNTNGGVSTYDVKLPRFG